jgi:ParB-like nuclease domain
MTGKMEFHPLAELLPLLEGNEFAELVASIKSVGLLEPITVYEGKILDGRNRYRACVEAAIEPRTEPLPLGQDPLAFVYNKNVPRRHLTPSQRAIAVAQYVTLLKNGNVAVQRNSGRAQDLPQPIMSASQAARLAQVSEDTMKRAKHIHLNGTAAEIGSVMQGKSTVKAMAKKIRARGNLRRGIPIKLPDGFDCLSAAVKPGIELELAGASTINAAKQIGISLQTYACVRDVVLLSERNDLSERDLKVVRAALKEINETRRVRRAQELVKPISLKVWGRNGNRYKSDKSRVTAFTESIMFVVTGCAAIADCEIPALERKYRAGTIKELNAAISALIKLRRRLKREEAP